MKQFLAFGGETKDYAVTGGWSDFIGSYDTEREALIALLKIRPVWYQIVDTALVFPGPLKDSTGKAEAYPPKIILSKS